LIVQAPLPEDLAAVLAAAQIPLHL
jgi:hypothetical protein